MRLATGIFPAASLMNHSCVPLIVNSFRGRELTVRALRPVEAGAEVTNCYGPHYRSDWLIFFLKSDNSIMFVFNFYVYR